MQNATSDTINLLCDLLSRQSLTPSDAGCQQLLSDKLEPLGFHCETLQFGEVTNLWAKLGDQKPLFVFAGHTDVVPPGPLDAWQSPPFDPTISNGNLTARGVADMKGGIAAMVTAVSRYLATHPKPKGSIAFLITSDEEGPAQDGTLKVMETLAARQEKIDYCIVGEASSETLLGDTIKIGRRGSLSAQLTLVGKQGHIAYPQLAENPIHHCLSLLQKITDHEWDQGNAHFPASSLQISNIHAGTGAGNIIPGECMIDFNIRYSPEIDHSHIQATIESWLKQSGHRYKIIWSHSASPFLTVPGKFTGICQAAIKDITGLEAQLSTGGGTSDGRFIAPTGAQLVELGVCNATIHQVNESVPVTDLDHLSAIYEKILNYLFE